MANYRSRSSRERRLRARYRKRVWTCGIIMLILGLVLGYVLCMTFLEDDASKDPALAVVTPTPIAVVTEVPTMEPTDAPTVEPTEVPTAEPTDVPTVEPTDAPTVAPTDVPMVAPTEAPVEPAIVFNSADVATAVPAEDGIAPLTDAVEDMNASSAPTETPEATAEASELPEATPEATSEVSATPEVAATPEATAMPVASAEPTVTPTPIIVPYGESCTFDTQIGSDGKARLSAEGEDYETLNLTMSVDAYKDPAYFEEHYADSYNLQGNEAAVEFKLTLNGYAGSAEIIPQDFLTITFCNEDQSAKTQGFQLMDTEIAGKTDIAITSDETATLYKRYPYNADQGDMTYMVVTTYNGGTESVYWFEILAPEAEVSDGGASGGDGADSATDTPASGETSLTVGSKGDEVKKLQAKLIELGLLSGAPDGHFGKYTASAVEIMQERFGMEKTGIADAAFLDKLYSE